MLLDRFFFFVFGRVGLSDWSFGRLQRMESQQRSWNEIVRELESKREVPISWICFLGSSGSISMGIEWKNNIRSGLVLYMFAWVRHHIAAYFPMRLNEDVGEKQSKNRCRRTNVPHKSTKFKKQFLWSTCWKCEYVYMLGPRLPIPIPLHTQIHILNYLYGRSLRNSLIHFFFFLTYVLCCSEMSNMCAQWGG